MSLRTSIKPEKSLAINKKSYILYRLCRGGGIGRRAGFKIRFLRKCEFDSRPRHQLRYSQHFIKLHFPTKSKHNLTS